MVMTDPIADMLTRIRNANIARHETVEIPASNMKRAIAMIMLKEGFIKSVEEIDDGKGGILKLTLKYGPNKERVISHYFLLYKLRRARTGYSSNRFTPPNHIPWFVSKEVNRGQSTYFVAWDP